VDWTDLLDLPSADISRLESNRGDLEEAQQAEPLAKRFSPDSHKHGSHLPSNVFLWSHSAYATQLRWTDVLHRTGDSTGEIEQNPIRGCIRQVSLTFVWEMCWLAATIWIHELLVRVREPQTVLH
jgi:hypothetical protein